MLSYWNAQIERKIALRLVAAARRYAILSLRFMCFDLRRLPLFNYSEWIICLGGMFQYYFFLFLYYANAFDVCVPKPKKKTICQAKAHNANGNYYCDDDDKSQPSNTCKSFALYSPMIIITIMIYRVCICIWFFSFVCLFILLSFFVVISICMCVVYVWRMCALCSFKSTGKETLEKEESAHKR